MRTHPPMRYRTAVPPQYFLYDMTPIMMTIRETRPGLLRLLVRLCAVVGGVFAVTGFWDKAIHGLVSALGRRGQHGAAKRLYTE